MGSLVPLIPSPIPVGVQGVLHITDGVDTLMYRDRDMPFTIAWQLVDQQSLLCYPEGLCWLASSPHHRDIELFACCTIVCSSSVWISH
jgi:hypothetical protein